MSKGSDKRLGRADVSGRRWGVKTVRLLAFAALALAGCQYADPDTTYPTRGPGGKPTYEQPESVFGPQGLSSAALFGNGEALPQEGGGAGIGVNSFLWRASLDTVSFMPLATADPFGGVIITDWYAPPETPSERFKVNVFILGRDLRADGVRARVFRQLLTGDNQWRDAEVDENTGIELENAILTRARQLRIAGLQ